MESVFPRRSTRLAEIGIKSAIQLGVRINERILLNIGGIAAQVILKHRAVILQTDEGTHLLRGEAYYGFITS